MKGEREVADVVPTSKATFSPFLVAEDFIKGEHLVHLLEDHQFWWYDRKDKIWKSDGESYLMSFMSSVYPGISKNEFQEVRFQILRRIIMFSVDFKPDPFFLNFQGTLFNLRDLILDRNSIDAYDDTETYIAEKHLRINLDTELDPKADQPWIFLSALQKAIPDPRDMFHCLQAFASILLIRTMRIEKAFFFLGSGGNGKSTIMKAIENIFPNYISHVDLGDLVKDQFAAGSLVDKLANVYSDIQSLKLKDMAIFKAISSGDTISINEKYSKRRDETIKVIQIYSANKMPYIDDKNLGFLRRCSPITFDMVIKNQDPYIDEKLNTPEERSKILNLLIKVARFTRDRGFIYEKKHDEILNILEEREDPITQFLNDTDWIKQDSVFEIERSTLFNLYREFCKEASCSPKLQTAFSRYITERGFQTHRKSNKRYWTGLGSTRDIKGVLL